MYSCADWGSEVNWYSNLALNASSCLIFAVTVAVCIEAFELIRYGSIACEWM
jgi:hypothetical protein